MNPAQTVLDRARAVTVATVTTRLFARGIRHSAMTGVGPLLPGMRLCGLAKTLRYVPAREDLDVLEVFHDPEHPQRKAVETILPGQVLVMDARGDSSAATLGSILATRLGVRGAAGVVTDGLVRDAQRIRALGLPVFCRGAHPATNLTAHHAVDIDVPVGCGGVLVMSGDLILGDDDGVVVVPASMAAEVVAEAQAQDRLEAYLARRIAEGAPLPGTYPPSAQTLEAYRREVERGG